jgi:signal recognition particle receptor subunit beta
MRIGEIAVIGPEAKTKDEFIRESNTSWDLVSKKLLGYVILFEWQNEASIHKIKSTIDTIADRYTVPLVIAANINGNNSTNIIPQQFIDNTLELSKESQFKFFNVTDPESARQVLLVLIDALLDQMRS